MVIGQKYKQATLNTTMKHGTYCQLKPQCWAHANRFFFSVLKWLYMEKQSIAASSLK